MEKSREQLVIEPDFGEVRLEETAGIPERIAPELVIEGEVDFLELPQAGTESQAGEEIAVLEEGVSSSVEIADDYLKEESPPESPESGDIDLLSIAAEIDSLVEVKRVAREVRGADDGLPEQRPPEDPEDAGELEVKSTNEILIHEDDDIDLDYYSLDDISDVEKREPDETGRRPKPDIERFEMLEPTLDAVVQSRAEEPQLKKSAAPPVPVEEPAPSESVPEEKKAGEAMITAAPAEERIAEAMPEEAPPERLREPAEMRKPQAEEFPAVEAPAAVSPPAEPVAEKPLRAEPLRPEPPRQEIPKRETPAPVLPQRESAPPKPERKKGNIITIEFPDALKEKMPEDFDREFGEIDLGEAEEIANENILMFNEDELIEELNDFNLFPLRSGEKETAKDVIPPRREESRHELKSAPEEEARGGDEVKELHELVLPGIEETAPQSPASGTSAATGQKEIEEPAELRDISFDVDILEDEEEARPAAFPRSAAEHGADASGVKREPAPDLRSGGRLLSEEPAGENPPPFGVARKDTARQDSKRPALERRPRVPLEKERLAPDLLQLGSREESIRFIDDGLVMKEEKESESIFKMDELERITAEIVEVIEGKAMELKEADAAEDLDNIAGIMRGTTPAFEDLLPGLETEYAFKDDDVEFIDNAFTKEDFGDYLKVIDDISGTSGGRQVSTAVELLGLDANEIGTIEQNAFLKDYSNVNIDEALKKARMGFDQPASDYRMSQKYTYLTPKPAALHAEDRKSIEEDISSDTALVYEEDVDEIRRRLDELKMRKAPAAGETSNISDRVVVMDSTKDVDRFIASLPKEKQESLRLLLKYLDGLFERLPEDVIKKFADSEYFELYSRVLSDLGE